LTGVEPINATATDKWKQTLAQRKQLFPDCVHLICPEKLAVLSDFAPKVTLDPDRLACVLGHQAKVIYPVAELAVQDDTLGASYSKTDTHFNDLGALRCVQLVLSEMSVSHDYDPQWRSISILGDLGMKMEPQIRSKKTVMQNHQVVEMSENGLQNRGRMMSFHNPQALEGRLLIFGDSFSGITLARMFANFVSDVLFVHSLSADYRIIQRYKPDFMLFEMAERFLRDLPYDGIMIEKLVLEKMLLNEDNKARVNKWRSDSDTSTSAFVDWDLIDFIGL
jgi:hypothetical protein